MTTAYVWILVIELASGIPDQPSHYVRIEQTSKAECLYAMRGMQKRIDGDGGYEVSVKCKRVTKELKE